MANTEIKSLKCISKLRTAPYLNDKQAKEILLELSRYMEEADWFTVGIMAGSADLAISNLREMEAFFAWPEMNVIQKPNEYGPVFLKANQKTNSIYIRIENGLGEGILISCQRISEEENAETFGPLPLNIFKK